MASVYFTYTPTGGLGNATVTVSANTQNTDGADRSATINFTNGTSSKNVTVIQRYKPEVIQGPTTVPAAGGFLSITAKTEYDITFRSVPEWITAITADGVTYHEGDRIPASVSGLPISFYCLPNTGNTSRSASTGGIGMNMAHYIGNTLVTSRAPIIYLTQYADTSTITTNVNELEFDYNGDATKTVQVITNGTWSSSISDN